MPVDLPGYRLEAPLRVAGPAGDTAESSPVPGGAAQVWSGRRLADDLAVALKLLHPADAARLAREAALTAAVDHPHVLPVLEVAGGPHAVALVTPLARGGSLAALLGARRRLRWPEVLTVLIPLADGLAAAHERGIVHGDLSAGNVLFDGDGRPLLGDLGAARAATECGVTVAVTPTDVAPEIARGADPSPAADLFSLGSVALHCLSGAPAWPADDLQDVLIQSAAGQWPDPDDLMGPPALLSIVRRLLDPDPARRGSAAQAAVELRRVGEPEPVELLTRQPDGTVSAPPPATVVRPDALRPPSMSGARGGRRSRRPARLRLPRSVVPPAGRHHRRRLLTRVGPTAANERAARHGPARAQRQRRPRVADRRRRAAANRPRRRWWSAAVAVGVVLLLCAVAVRAGLWWADRGATSPTAVAAVAGAHEHVDGTSTKGSSPPKGGSPSRVSSHGSATGAGAPDADWLSVVTTLDDARAAALTARDSGLLRRAYTADAPARRADARRISTMTSAGYHVTAATHHVQSVTLVRIGDDDSVTLRVVESMPSYPIVDADGSVVGSTTASGRSVVLLELRPTDDGFRIDRITRS